MKKLSKEQIIEQLENGIEQLKNIFSETVIENEQERIIRKNRIIAKLERENEILRIKLEENHTIFSENGNKAAGTRARKAAGEFKKIVTDYRKASVAESK